MGDYHNRSEGADYNHELRYTLDNRVFIINLNSAVKEAVKEHHTEAHTEHMINRATRKVILSGYKTKTAN